MRTRYIVCIGVFIALLLATVIVFYSAKSEPPDGYPVRDDIMLEKVDESKYIGDSSDGHGCIGPAGYEWCPSQSRCMRTWEEYCEEFSENYRGDENKLEDIFTTEGDTGENPPEESVNWATYTSDTSEFYFQYPPEYHIVEKVDDQPHAIVYLVRDEDSQSYDLTVEKWEQEELAEIEKRIEEDLPHFAIMEHPHTDELISFTCWNDDVAQDCKDMYLTVGFQ